MKHRWPVHTVVFDLDDTLYPESEFVLSGFAAVDAWLCANYKTPGFYVQAVQVFNQGKRKTIFDEVLPLIGLPVTTEAINEMIGVYRAHTPVLTLFPDAQEILSWTAEHFNLGLITDGYADVQKLKIKALGLDARIHACIVSDELGRDCWKPSTAPYIKIMERFPSIPEGYLYVGDNARKDFLGARSLGWKTVRIQRVAGEHVDYSGLTHEKADLEILSLLELKDIIVSSGKSL